MTKVNGVPVPKKPNPIYSFIVLVLISMLFSAISVAVSIHQNDTTKHDFCDIVHEITSNPVPKPADPGANPSRQGAYINYEKFLVLQARLGCGPPPQP